MSTPVVRPGTFPVDMLDQRKVWVGTDGRAYDISDVDEESILWVLDYSLANAKMLRERWAIEKRETYDTSQRARQWMLQRPAIRALLRRLVVIENEVDALALDESQNAAAERAAVFADEVTDGNIS